MILEKMVIDDEQSQSNFKKLFFLIEFILMCSSEPKGPRVSSCGMVENLDAVEITLIGRKSFLIISMTL
jgi:hypothetical protein